MTLQTDRHPEIQDAPFSAKILKLIEVYKMCILIVYTIVELGQCPVLRDNIIFRFPDHSYNREIQRQFTTVSPSSSSKNEL